MKSIVFTGGGTAGHIMPNLAIIDQLKNYKIYYFGSNGLEKDIISKYNNIEFIEIPSVKFIRSLTLKNLLIPIKLIRCIKKCKDKLKEIKPALIFSKGGYVSIPVCLAGAQLKINILTHESDITIGLANKLIAKKAKHLCCSFKETALKYKKNAIHTGSPIRNKIYKGKKSTIIERHKITNNRPIITIIGGSLGASAINTIIWDSIDKLTSKYNIIHIVGKNKLNKKINKPNYFQLEFVDDIENYFQASDLIISRAGSNTIFELLSLKKPMLLIPLPKTQSRGDQILNAENFHNNKLANLLYQEDLSTDNLLNKIEETYKNKLNYLKSIEKYKNPNGNNKLLELIYIYTH